MVSSIPLPPTQRTLDTGVLDLGNAQAPPLSRPKRRPSHHQAQRSRHPRTSTKPPKVRRQANSSAAETRPARHAAAYQGRHRRDRRHPHRPVHTGAQKRHRPASRIQDRTFGERYRLLRATSSTARCRRTGTRPKPIRIASMDKSTTILFDIDRDGIPSNARIETRSGSPSSRSLRHARGAACRRLRPPALQGNHITVEYTFHFRPQ